MSISILDPPRPMEPMEKMMMIAKDSTLSTALGTVVGGYVMGFGFSLFGAFIAADTATQAMGTLDFFKFNIKAASRLGSSFAFFGFLFGGIEVALEKRRGRKDWMNATAAGGFIGAFYGWRSYRYPGLAGGLVGGAFISWMFDALMDRMGWGQH